MKRFFSTALFTIAALLAIPQAQAHTELVNATPVANENLNTFPDVVSLTFNENLLVIKGEVSNFLTVKDSEGTEVTTGEVSISGSAISRPMDSTSTSTGIFTVTYRVVSADGHPVNGSYQFSVNTKIVEPIPSTSSGESAKNDASFINRNLNVIGAGLILMALVVGHFIYRRLRSE